MKLLLTHTPTMRANYYGPQALAALRELVEVQLHHGDEALDTAALIAAAADVELILSDRQTPADAAVFAALPKLRVFLRCAVDVRTVDLAAASKAGVLVTRAKPGFVDSVTELALGFLVDLARGVSHSTAEYHAGRRPTARVGRQLAGSTLGIIGYGAIGQRLAAVATALNMTVLITDPYAVVADPGLRHVALETLLSDADHVVCLAIATAETENLIDAAALARMKPDAVFINLSRGDLVDETALSDALRAGKIAGAGLDVGRAPDQMPQPALAALENVIATPHIGGLTPPAIAAQALDTVAQVAALVRGAVPHGAINVEHWLRR